MRIVSGRLRGRTFESPGNFKTHPMSDKARAALFNILGDVEGLTVLDPFAGSGALSFEAISRGAVHATAIEIDKAAQRTIAANSKALQLENEVKLIRASAAAWLNTSDGRQFDLVLCDPPYDDLHITLIERLASSCVAPEGLLVLSWPSEEAALDVPGMQRIKRRTYAHASLIFYRRR